MRRRQFIRLFGAAALAPSLHACTQSRERPTIGFLHSASANAFIHLVTAFHEGLNDEGYTEGLNIVIEYRWADGQYDRLPALVADLVRRKVAVIAAMGGIVSARAAQAATSTIPILFVSGFDPVQLGLVNSLHRPDGNSTGASVFTTELMAKRLQLLREMVPQVATIALLLNPANVLTGGIEKKDLEIATRAIGVQLRVVEAVSESDFEAAFTSAVQQGVGAILVSADPFFTSRRVQLVALAALHGMPAAYPWREYVEVGGLMSYGPDIKQSYRQIGHYAGRILKGAKTSDLPVQLPTRFPLIINLKTAMALGLAVPRQVLVTANEVIE